MPPKIGEELQKAISGKEIRPDAEVSRKILILSFLSMHPCSTSTAIARFLDTSERGVMWHTDSLVRKEIIGRRDGKKTRFFIRNHIRDGDCPVFSILGDERAKKILLLLEESAGMSNTEILEETGMARQSARNLLGALEGAQIVRSLKEGRNRRYYLTEKLAEMREDYASRREMAGNTMKEILNELAGSYEVLSERDGMLMISMGDRDLKMATDPFTGVFTG